MQHLDLIALRYFAETADCGSIRQASDRLHVTPSAVSRRIAKLEHQLETLLFERRATGVVLTPSGQVLAQEVGTIYTNLARVQGLIGDLEGLRRGEVIIYCMEGATDWWLADVVSAYRLKYPKISFKLNVSSTARSMEALIRGECDIAIMLRAPRRPEIKIVESIADPLVALVAPTHELAEQNSVDFLDLLKHELVLPNADFGVRQLFDRQVRKLKAQPRCLVTTNSIAMVRSLVRFGTVATTLPRLSARHDCDLGLLKSILITRTTDFHACVELCVRRDRTLTVAAAEMLDMLRTSLKTFLINAPATERKPVPDLPVLGASVQDAV